MPADGSIAAVIAAITALIGAVFTGIYKFLQSYDGRMDKTTAASFDVLRAQVTDALEGEDRMRQERDDARREMAKAYRERDRWQERATTAELKLAMRDPNADDT